jgi:sugar phosphate permease
MATGLVNGIGSVGAVLTGFAIPLISKLFGWQALFPTLVVLAFAAAISLAPTFRRSP